MLRTARLDVRATAPDATTTIVRDSQPERRRFRRRRQRRRQQRVSHGNVNRYIDWESTTILLGEPNPTIHIDADGIVVELINITGHSANGAAGARRHRRRGDIVLDDIIYDTRRNAFFFADELTGTNSSFDEGPDGQIWGNAAIFDFQETWDYVTIVNESDARPLRQRHRRREADPSSNTIQIDVKNVPDSGTPAPTSAVDSTWARADRFHFEVIHSYIPTVVDHHRRPGAPARRLGRLPQRRDRQPDRHRPRSALQRRHRVQRHRANPGGYANGTDQLIRTNVLAPRRRRSASIGTHTSPGQPHPAQRRADRERLHRRPGCRTTGQRPVPPHAERHLSPSGKADPHPTDRHHRRRRRRHRAHRPLEPPADATRRALDQFVITFGPITAGDDIDIFVLDSIDRTDAWRSRDGRTSTARSTAPT